jgi:hypothetical protein
MQLGGRGRQGCAPPDCQKQPSKLHQLAMCLELPPLPARRPSRPEQQGLRTRDVLPPGYHRAAKGPVKRHGDVSWSAQFLPGRQKPPVPAMHPTMTRRMSAGPAIPAPEGWGRRGLPRCPSGRGSSRSTSSGAPDVQEAFHVASTRPCLRCILELLAARQQGPQGPLLRVGEQGGRPGCPSGRGSGPQHVGQNPPPYTNPSSVASRGPCLRCIFGLLAARQQGPQGPLPSHPHWGGGQNCQSSRGSGPRHIER